MSDIISVTNRLLCRDEFSERLKKIAAAGPKAIILREKDLDEETYYLLAKDANETCKRSNVPLIIHSFYDIAKRLGIGRVHLPMDVLRTMTAEDRNYFSVLGASCHSADESRRAQELGCTYITAGHIFKTDCKRNLPPRGVEFLREIISSVDIPVYAIGGICAGNYGQIKTAGAAGACVMSGLMICADPDEFLKSMSF